MLDQGNESTPDATSAGSVELLSSSPQMNVTPEDIDNVKNLIERCLQLYMNRDEAMHTLFAKANIQPVFTNLVWKKLEEQNPSFFNAYYTWLQVKKQIKQFNGLLEQQYCLIQHSAISSHPSTPTPTQNGMYELLDNQMSMGFPTLEPSSLPLSGQVEMDVYPSPFVHKNVHNIPHNLHLMQMPMPMESQDKYTFQAPLTDATEVHHNPAPMAPSCQLPLNAIEMGGIKTNPVKFEMFSSQMPVASTQNQLAIPSNYGQSNLMSMAPNGEFHFRSTPFVESLPSTGISAFDTFSSHLATPDDPRLGPESKDGSSSGSVLPLTSIPWDLSFPELPAEDSKFSEADEFFADPTSGSGSCSSFHLGEERP